MLLLCSTNTRRWLFLRVGQNVPEGFDLPYISSIFHLYYRRVQRQNCHSGTSMYTTALPLPSEYRKVRIVMLVRMSTYPSFLCKPYRLVMSPVRGPPVHWKY